jgi:hypothetical protein
MNHSWSANGRFLPHVGLPSPPAGGMGEHIRLLSNSLLRDRCNSQQQPRLLHSVKFTLQFRKALPLEYTLPGCETTRDPMKRGDFMVMEKNQPKTRWSSLQVCLLNTLPFQVSLQQPAALHHNQLLAPQAAHTTVPEEGTVLAVYPARLQNNGGPHKKRRLPWTPK